MHKRTITLLAIGLMLFAVLFNAKAATASSSEQHLLRWSDIEAAIDRHPALRIINDEVATKKTEIKVSRQYPNPEFSASVGQARSLDGKQSALIWGVELEIPIDAPGAYLNETASAKASFKAAKLAATIKRLEVRNQLKGLFFEIAIGQELLSVQQKNMEQINSLLQVAALRVEHGEARPMEVTRLQIEQEKLQLEVLAASDNLKVSKKNMNLWLGKTLPVDFEVRVNWQNLPDISELKKIIKTSNDTHPLVLAANNQIIAAEFQTRTQWHSVFPQIKLGGFYDREMDAHNYGGMIGIELPLWNWNMGGIAKARAEEALARTRQEFVRLQLVTALTKAHADAHQAVYRAKTYATSILPKAIQAGEAIEAMYKVGETNIINVLDARRNLIETETDMLEAFKDGWLAYLELVTLMGGEHE